nr:IS21 family IstB ATP-binding protein [Enterobacter asburiae]
MHNNLLEQIRALRLAHMSNALELQWSQPMTYTSLSFEERLGLLLEHELLQHEVSKVNRLRRQSKLRLDAQPSQLDYRPKRGLNRQLLVQLLTGAYVHRHENVLSTGPTGCGKTYVACALGEGSIALSQLATPIFTLLFPCCPQAVSLVLCWHSAQFSEGFLQAFSQGREALTTQHNPHPAPVAPLKAEVVQLMRQ